MKIINNTTEFQIEEETVVVIGKFDGFHRGHQTLMEKAVCWKKRGMKVAVFTFVPSPAAFFSKEPVKELTTVEEKRQIFEKTGVDYLIEFPFNREIADMEPEVYICDVLVRKMNAKVIVAGTDVTYGKKGAGDYRLLCEKAALYAYQVELIDKVEYENKEISSTYVRDEVKLGNMELVTKLLGTPFHIAGEIVHGKQLGRTIGMPTVNILPSEDKLLPPKGVYYSYVVYENQKYPAITNIGVKPTVQNNQVMGVETYLYNFSGNLYGEKLEVYLLKFKRPEMHFPDFEHLKEQMQQDLADGKEFHGL